METLIIKQFIKEYYNNYSGSETLQEFASRKYAEVVQIVHSVLPNVIA